ncbi:PREDICTED: hydroxysteroid 11-beta-dehydrogenase 1-like protein isoform X2 [Condylura cristata]|uniref:hydroxysteroid 11-beta-dehydrogenase 1-like protein isoform X2 n=1 Tax=Condylura cristata TaxID=143302 RepID=UPI000643988A|nr:PREDICTED: hydroxysteroid 11-beta-dehydrogenase 1-like protein isoform X2 [Condylura cristata]
MKVLLLTGLGALFFAYYWDDKFDPASLQGARVLLTGASAGVGEELAYHYARLGSHLVITAQREALLQKVNFLSYVQLTSLALPSLTDSKGSLVVVSSLLGRVPTSFSSPYSAAKLALDGFFSSLRRELDVQDVNVAITMCVLGLQDLASATERFRGITRAKAAPGPKAALAVIRGGATRASRVFYPWRFHLLCLLRGWLPQPRPWFIRQEFNSTATAAA